MNEKRWPLASLALIAVAALVSACGSSQPTGAGGGRGGNTSHEQAVKFAECMRTNGVSEFPDPDASGRLTIDAVANGSSLNINTPAFKHAVGACKGLEPAGFMGTKRSALQQSAGLKFARCIRQNGVPDFPDPLPNGPLVDTNRIPSSNQPGGRSILDAAMRRCRTMAIAAGVTQ